MTNEEMAKIRRLELPGFKVGVLDVPAEQVAQKGRLQPGRMFLIDTEEGRIVADEEIKGKIAVERPYRLWLNEHLVHLEDLPAAPGLPVPDANTLLKRQIAFGYTYEDQRILLAPMARDGVEAVGSMGNDAALAVLSNQPRILYDYFKQLFAQVTNPPIDSIREDLIISAETRLGSEGNLLNPQPSACRRVTRNRMGSTPTLKPGSSRRRIFAISSLVMIGHSSSTRRHADGCGFSRLPSEPSRVSAEMIRSSRMLSMGGLVTCAKSCLK